jgi:hypothetical protein
MTRRKRIIVVSISMGCLCLVVVLAIVGGSSGDILARIERNINTQGCCMISGAWEVEIQAQSARMENGCLVLYGSCDPGKEPCVLVTLWPGMGSGGICSAPRVSIERASHERLKLTFHQPTYLPRHMSGRSRYVSLRKTGWLRELTYETRVRIRYMLKQRQKKQSVSP